MNEPKKMMLTRRIANFLQQVWTCNRGFPLSWWMMTAEDLFTFPIWLNWVTTHGQTPAISWDSCCVSVIERSYQLTRDRILFDFGDIGHLLALNIKANQNKQFFAEAWPLSPKDLATEPFGHFGCRTERSEWEKRLDSGVRTRWDLFQLLSF